MGSSAQTVKNKNGLKKGAAPAGAKGRKKQIRVRRKGRFLFFLAAVILLVWGGYSFLEGMRNSEEAPHIAEIAGIPVTHHFLETSVPGRPGIERRIQCITIHETGNTSPGANAKAHDSYLQEVSRVQEISWHYTVDDHEIYHHLPDNEVGYNAGDGHLGGEGNRTGIGVELCVNQDGDFEKTLENGAVLTAWLLNAYGLKPSDVKKHQDFSGKLCPEILIESGRWEEFLEMVKQCYEEKAYQ